MLVNKVTHACHHCGEKSEPFMVLVNIFNIEDIKLQDTAVSCTCGYFYTYKHSVVSCDIWKQHKALAEIRVESARDDVNRMKAKALAAPTSQERGYCNEYVDQYQERLKEREIFLKSLGNYPIPDVIYQQKSIIVDLCTSEYPDLTVIPSLEWDSNMAYLTVADVEHMIASTSPDDGDRIEALYDLIEEYKTANEAQQ